VTRRSGDGKAPGNGSNRTSRWEWFVALVGLAITLGTIGFVLWEAAFGDDGPPDVVVTVDSIREVQAGYLVSFQAENRGGQTAEGVDVEGVLERDGEEVEIAATTLDYVPAGSARRGGLFFERNPDAYVLSLVAKGYEQP
jgi:uncharacterized protein (TIGR02588 family)